MVLRGTRPTTFGELVTVLLFLWCAGLLSGLIWIVLCVWGAPMPGAGETTVDVHWIGSGATWVATTAAANAVLMFAAGALGGAVHTARSLASKTGAATFQPRWAWWYLLTPLIGAAAGFVVTLGVQGGALDSGGAIGADTQNALATFVAFVSGLFARAALERLERFLPRPDQSAGQIRVVKVAPDTMNKATTAQTFVITGSGLRDDTTVKLGDLGATSVTRADGTLTARFDNIPPAAAAHQVYLVVENSNASQDVTVVTRT
jgi:hypothetical protein